MSASISQAVLTTSIGHVHTTAAFYDLVAPPSGSAAPSHRLIATAQFPTHANVGAAVESSVAELGRVTRRPFNLDATDSPDGVRTLVSAVGVMTPLTVTLFTTADPALAERHLRQTGSKLVRVLDARALANSAEMVQELIQTPSDVHLIVGNGSNVPSAELLALLELASAARELLPIHKRPPVLFAGSSTWRQAISRIFTGQTAVTMLPLLPTTPFQAHRLNSALSDIARQRRLPELAGFDRLDRQLSVPAVAELDALIAIVRYLASVQNGLVLMADLGSSHCTLLAATPSGSEVVDDPSMGMGAGVASLATPDGCAALQRWLPFEVDSAEVQDYLANKALHPHTRPFTEQAQAIEAAAARHFLQMAAAQLWTDDLTPQLLILGGGTLAQAADPLKALLLVLDALQPSGLFAVARDRHGLLPGLGALASAESLAVVQALDHGLLEDVAWVVAPRGQLRSEQPALKATLSPDSAESMDIMVNYGNLEVLSLTPDRATRLRLSPLNGCDLGRGPNKAIDVTLQGRRLIMDLRGRPLTLPPDESARRRLQRHWQRAIA